MTKTEISSKELIICSIVSLSWTFFIWVFFGYLIIKHDWSPGSLFWPLILGMAPGSVHEKFFKEKEND